MDVLESFIAIKARPDQIWPFLTEEPWIEAWIAPSAELVGLPGTDGTLAVGSSFDMVLHVPTMPVLHCRVRRADEQGIEVDFQGPGHGLASGQLLPAGHDTVVRLRFEYELADPRWLAPWALAGRWLAVLHLGYLLRRLKGRVQDAVGSSTFGPPLLVSPYALAAGAAVVGLLLGLWAKRVLKWFKSRR